MKGKKMEMAKKQFASRTINSLIKHLYDKKLNLFNLHYSINSKKIDKTKTAFVNAHCIYCLNELGYKKQARDMLLAMMKSKLFDQKKHLFRFLMKNGKILNPDKNGCSNLLMLKNFASLGFKDEASKLKKAIIENLFDKNKGLFRRSVKDKNLFVAQTNLWAAKALESLGMKIEAKRLIKNIIKRFYQADELISSSSTQKGKYKEKYIFSDDNFLFCWIANKYYPGLCKRIAAKLMKSGLLDKKTGLFNRSIRLNDNFLNTDKSAYKNAICLLGLKELKHSYAPKLEKAMVKHLYNKKANLFYDCFSDSNLLACYALSK